MKNEVILKKCSIVEISVIDLGSTPKSVLAFKRYILNRLFFRICASRTFRMRGAKCARSHSPRSCGVYRANANVLRSLRSKKRNGIVDISFCIIERKKNNKKNLVQAFQSLKPRIIRIHIQLIQN